jgi:hypothetical protein
MKIVPVVGKTYYGNWRHYTRTYQSYRGDNFNEQRSVFIVRRALNVTPCHSCPCHSVVIDFHGEFDCWGCSLKATVVEMPTRMSDENSHHEGEFRPDCEVVGSEDCPLVSIQHRDGTYLKPTATVTVYEIERDVENRLVPEVT